MGFGRSFKIMVFNLARERLVGFWLRAENLIAQRLHAVNYPTPRHPTTWFARHTIETKTIDLLDPS